MSPVTDTDHDKVLVAAPDRAAATRILADVDPSLWHFVSVPRDLAGMADGQRFLLLNPPNISVHAQRLVNVLRYRGREVDLLELPLRPVCSSCGKPSPCPDVLAVAETT